MASTLIDAIKSTTREILHDQRREWRKVLAGLDAEAVNWKPGKDANSIAALVAHTFDAERFLMTRVVGVTFDRDREAKFRMVASGADELLRIIEETEKEVDECVDRMGAEALVADLPHTSGPHLGAWWPLHALEHSREHLGQALLTRQMYEQGRR
jgi:uncharacterized damage-inducible protein DinB